MNATDYDWALGERDLQRSDFRSCPECSRMMGQPSAEHIWYCDVHRCRATTAQGHQCKNVVSGENPMHCKAHACVADWVLPDGSARVRCAGAGSMQTIPDGRRVRICDEHRQKFNGHTGHEAA